MPLVTHVANAIWSKQIGRRIGEFEDLVASGYEPLIRAAELYKPTHASCASFKTYAYRSLLRAMLRAADEAGVIRIPVTTLRAVKSPSSGYEQPEESVCRSVEAAVGMTSLPTDYDAAIDEDPMEAIWRQEIRDIANSLPEEISEAITRSFGLNCQQESMISIGIERGVTGQAIRQRRKRGLERIGDRLMDSGLGATDTLG